MAKKKVETAQETAVALPTPSFLEKYSAPPTTEVPEAQSRSGDYVLCLQDRSSCKDAAMKSGVSLGDFFLVRPDGYVALRPFKYHVFDFGVFYTKMNQSGEVTQCSEEHLPGLDEHFVTLLWIVTPEGIIPSRTEFRKSLSGAIRPALEALRMDATVWAAKSNEHKATLAVSVPAMRFYAEATTRKSVVKSGPNAGSVYFAGQSVVVPVTPGYLEGIVANAQTPEFQEAFAQAEQGFQERLSQLRKMVK